MGKIITIPAEYMPEIDELPGELPMLAEIIEEHFPGMGVKVTLAIAQERPSLPIFIHNVESIARRIRDDGIRKDYDTGRFTMVQLGEKCHLGIRRIKQILAQPDSQEELESKQMRLW